MEKDRCAMDFEQEYVYHGWWGWRRAKGGVGKDTNVLSTLAQPYLKDEKEFLRLRQGIEVRRTYWWVSFFCWLFNVGNYAVLRIVLAYCEYQKRKGGTRVESLLAGGAEVGRSEEGERKKGRAQERGLEEESPARERPAEEQRPEGASLVVAVVEKVVKVVEEGARSFVGSARVGVASVFKDKKEVVLTKQGRDGRKL